jgi:ATP synthase protein I
MDENKGSFYSQLKQIGVLTTIPIILVAGPVAGFFTGGWIDRKFQSYPWFTILFLFLGLGASGREIFRLLKQVLKEETKKASK